MSFSLSFFSSEEQAVIKDPSQVECESIPEYTAEEECEDNRLWRTVVIGEQEQRIDIKAIEPYKRVISHGGRGNNLKLEWHRRQFQKLKAL